MVHPTPPFSISVSGKSLVLKYEADALGREGGG